MNVEEQEYGAPKIFEEKIREALEGLGLDVYRIKTVRYKKGGNPSYKIVAHSYPKPNVSERVTP